MSQSSASSPQVGDLCLPLKKRTIHLPPQMTPLDLSKKPDGHLLGASTLAHIAAPSSPKPPNLLSPIPVHPLTQPNLLPLSGLAPNFNRIWTGEQCSYPPPLLLPGTELHSAFQVAREPPQPPPKYFMSAFAHFMAHKRSILKQEGRSIIKLTDWVKSVAECWRRMSAEDQKPFRDIAQSDRLRYHREHEHWKYRMTRAGHNIKDLQKNKQQRGRPRKSIHKMRTQTK